MHLRFGPVMLREGHGELGGDVCRARLRIARACLLLCKKRLPYRYPTNRISLTFCARDGFASV